MQLIRESKEGIEICNKDLYKGTAVKGVLFDMDGVILDTEKLYLRFWKEAARVCGYEMTEEMALGMRSLNHSAGERRIREYFGESADYHKIRNKRIELMDIFVNEYGVDSKPGICELLTFLKENNIKRAVATASPKERAKQHLTSVGVWDAFESVVSVQSVKHGKPEPDVFLYAAEVLGLQPEECIVLEDSPNGLLAAYRAGCVPVMVPDQDGPDDETRKIVYAVADNLMSVIELLNVV